MKVIEIVEYSTDKVVKRLYPKTDRDAEKADNGLNRQLNHEKYFTRIVEDEESN